VANDTTTLLDIDGRLRIARRFRDITRAILVDRGGADACSEACRQLIRRFAATCVLAEDVESRLACGEEIDVERHALLCSTLTRLASRIGINRVPKAVGMTLGQLIAEDQERARLERQHEREAREEAQTL
jgi:hypothetical protein